MADAPKFDVDLVIPARNHERVIGQVIREIPRGLVRSIVVVASGSTDGTARVAEDAGAVVVRESLPGLGAACLRAVAHMTTLPTPPAAVVFMAPDGSDDPRDLPGLVKPMEGGLFDLVIGSRRLGRRLPRVAPVDLVAVNLIHAIYGHRYTDVGSLRAVRYPALIALGLADTGAGYFVEMQVKAVRVGLRIAEVPAHEREPFVRDEHGDGLGGLKQRIDRTGRALYAILRHATAR